MHAAGSIPLGDVKFLRRLKISNFEKKTRLSGTAPHPGILVRSRVSKVMAGSPQRPAITFSVSLTLSEVVDTVWVTVERFCKLHFK